MFAGVEAGAELSGSLTWIKDKGNELARRLAQSEPAPEELRSRAKDLLRQLEARAGELHR